jgi:hypothetical protein
MSLLRLLALIVLCGVVAGCTGDANKGTVNGTVTLDGQPLKSGLIRFDPVDGQTATADAPITDGKFTAVVPIGERKVWISSPKVTGKRKAYTDVPDSPMVDIVEELLPPRYHVASQQKITITAGEQTPTFDLKSK